MKLIEYTSQQAAAEGLSQLVSQQLKSTIVRRGMASLAVPGGSTPGLFLKQLGQAALEWNKINITTTDERQVPIDHARSNARLINESLLLNPQAKPAFFALNQGLDLDQLRQQFARYFIPLDICVLGMGDDGHTASLFPGVEEDLLSPTAQQLIAEVQPPGDLEARYTLSARALLMAQYIHILIHGVDKKKVLDVTLNGEDILQMPVRCIWRYANARVMIHYAPN
jgi:6-phosphogluconolactonase